MSVRSTPIKIYHFLTDNFQAGTQLPRSNHTSRTLNDTVEPSKECTHLSTRSCPIYGQQFPTNGEIIYRYVSVTLEVVEIFLFFLIECSNVPCRTTTSTDWQHICRLSFIENQIKICEAIQSPMELEYWYAMLGAHLASHGTEKRIRFLLDDLLGPTHSFVDGSKVTHRTILVSETTNV